jgi:hypothetical protein
MDTDVGDEEFVKALGPKGAMAAVSQPAATSKEKDEGGWHTAKRSKTKHPALTISSDSGSVKLAAIQELILWGLQLSNADPRRFGLVLEHRNHLARIVVVIIEARGAACSYLLLWLLLASSVKLSVSCCVPAPDCGVESPCSLEIPNDQFLCPLCSCSLTHSLQGLDAACYAQHSERVPTLGKLGSAHRVHLPGNK